MLRKEKYMLPIASLLVVVLVCIMASAQTCNEPFLPDSFYHGLIESGGESIHYFLYIKDGTVYYELNGKLMFLDDSFLEQLISGTSEFLEENENPFEIREVSPAMIGDQKATHYQIFFRDTGVLYKEDWYATDLDILFPLKSVTYGEEGNVTSKITFVEFDLNPDFSQIDFGSAFPISLSGSPPEVTRLTLKEFEDMVPWYDVSQTPLEGYNLAYIHRESSPPYPDNFLTIVVTYSDGSQFLRVEVFGERVKVAEIHGPSEFSLLSRVSHNGVYLEPAIRSQRTNVIIGFLDPINRSDGNIFLKSVVLHPAR